MSESTTALQVLNPTRQLHRGNVRGRRSPYSQAVALQDLAFQAAHQKELTPVALAALARAWDVLEERKRILRGVPMPGQLRPDLDPVQLQRAIKRARARRPFDIAGAVTSAVKILETDAETVQPPTTRPQKAKPETKAQAEPPEPKANDPEQQTDDEAEAG